MKRPHVICHMMSTVDGRIIVANWGNTERKKTYSVIYETCHESFNAQAWMVGRVTMEKDFTKGTLPELAQVDTPIAREPFIGDINATSFAIAVDSHGKLGWTSNEIGSDHLIEVLTEQVSDDYLHYLRQRSISYIFAGSQTLDLRSALIQLGQLFPIRTIMLEGGGHINGSLLKEGLIDEISLLILPIADGTPNTPTTFELGGVLNGHAAASLTLNDVQRLEHDVLWLKYNVRPTMGPI